MFDDINVAALMTNWIMWGKHGMYIFTQVTPGNVDPGSEEGRVDGM